MKAYLPPLTHSIYTGEIYARLEYQSIGNPGSDAAGR
jgi:hypothetical protein